MLFLQVGGRVDTRRLPRPLPPDGRLRVGVLTPALCYGGAERWIVDLLRSTDPHRIRWEGVALTLAHHRVPECLAQLTAPVCWGPEAVAELSGRCDLLIVWGLPDWPRLLSAARPPVVLVSHGTCGFSREAVRHAAEAEHLVAVAPVAVAPFPETERSRVRVLPNGVDLARCRAQLSRTAQRRRWGVPARARVLGFLGRLSAEKRPAAVVEALAHLPAGWHAVLVGEGPLRPWLEHRARELGLAGRVRLPGYTTDIGSALRAFDALAVPSESEGYGLAIAEGWGAGVPVLATRDGIVAERPELCRVLPPSPNGEQLAAAVGADQADPDATAARVRTAAAWVRAEVALPEFGARWTEFLTAAGTVAAKENGRPEVPGRPMR